jgi:branched-chain amino acid transport system permease protein
VPFLVSLPLASSSRRSPARVRRTLYRRLYRARPRTGLFSIGLVFMPIAAATYVFGSQQPVQLLAVLRGQVHLLGIDLGSYRFFLIKISR